MVVNRSKASVCLLQICMHMYMRGKEKGCMRVVKSLKGRESEESLFKRKRWEIFIRI